MRLFVILVFIFMLSTTVCTSVGIWYSTWYANHGNYKWIAGHGRGSAAQFLADVNGDGKDDAIIYFNDGSWYIALSTGFYFQNYTFWGNFGQNSSKQLINDVNGDGKYDIVLYDNGLWAVALSNGTNFISTGVWISDYGVGSKDQLLADVNGDNKADAICIFTEENEWYVSISTGTFFLPYKKWISGGSTGNVQLAADVNGDQKDDAISVVIINGTSNWHVALSTGSSFLPWRQYMTSFGDSVTSVLCADVDGDGLSDAVAVSTKDNIWFSCRSASTHFPCSGHSLAWKIDHVAGASNYLLGNVFGDMLYSPVSYIATTGAWYVLPSDIYYFKPNIWNTWQAWNLDVFPLISKQIIQYDSSDISVIDAHISSLDAIGVNFLILDETNNLHVDNNYIFDRAQIVCKRIKELRISGVTRIQYMVAIGGMQFSDDPQVMEAEAGEVWDAFVTSSNCGGVDTYFSLSFKPVLASYASWKQRQKWEKWSGDKTNSSKFDLWWVDGTLPENSTIPPPSLYHQYCGWGLP
jgi:hypothetical protein